MLSNNDRGSYQDGVVGVDIRLRRSSKVDGHRVLALLVCFPVDNYRDWYIQVSWLGRGKG